MSGGLPRGGFDRQTIDAIVREVLARLAAKPSAAPLSAAPLSAAPAPAGAQVIAERVVSIRALEGRIKRDGQVVLTKGAIVTPAARDLLREQNIVISYAIHAPAPATGLRVSLATAATTYDAAALIQALALTGVLIERLAPADLLSAIERLSSVVTQDQLGVLLTQQSAAAVCLANRQAGVRAAVAGNVAEVSAAVESVGCNLLVIDPAGRSLFNLQQMAGRFLAAGTRPCPAAWIERLG